MNAIHELQMLKEKLNKYLTGSLNREYEKYLIGANEAAKSWSWGSGGLFATSNQGIPTGNRESLFIRCALGDDFVKDNKMYKEIFDKLQEELTTLKARDAEIGDLNSQNSFVPFNASSKKMLTDSENLIKDAKPLLGEINKLCNEIKTKLFSIYPDEAAEITQLLNDIYMFFPPKPSDEKFQCIIS